jgi:RimJ/RimL family protein N-acetyltransferase
MDATNTSHTSKGQQPLMDNPADGVGIIFNIVGDKVALGPLRRDLIPVYHRWINDFEVTRTLAVAPYPRTLDAQEDWYERNGRSEREAVFTIYELSTSRPIGNTSLDDVDQTNRCAEFGIFIGEKDAWGKGYGTEATCLMLEYGFTVLGLHNIILKVLSFNERGIRAYQTAGFREIGRRRQARWIGGRPADLVYMDCLSSEFEGRHLRHLLPPQNE